MGARARAMETPVWSPPLTPIELRSRSGIRLNIIYVRIAFEGGVP